MIPKIMACLETVFVSFTFVADDELGTGFEPEFVDRPRLGVCIAAVEVVDVIADALEDDKLEAVFVCAAALDEYDANTL